MYRMSQKLLTIFISLMIPLSIFANNWKLLFSIDTGPEGRHLKTPMSIYFQNNKIYIVDSGNSRLLSYTVKGKPLNEFNAGGSLKYPVAMIKDSNGNLWIIERASNSLMFVNLRNKKIISKQVTYKNHPLFLSKIGMWKNKIITIDRFTGKLIFINKDFNVEKEIFPESSNFKGFFDFKIKGNQLWAMESLTGRLFKYNFLTNSFKTINLNRKFTEPVSFDIDKNGNIYILDRYLQKVFIFDSNGIFLNTQLKQGNRAGELYYPWYIKIVDNKVFILDEGNGRVDVFEY